MTLGARAIVEDADGQILLVRHTYTKGLYLPGGGVEGGETVRQAICKELEEEAGIHVTGTPVQIGIYSNHNIMRNDHVVLFRLDAGAWEQTGQPDAREILETIWCNPLHPPTDATPATKRRLKEQFGDAERSEHW